MPKSEVPLAQLREFFSLCGDALCVLGPDGSVELANPAFGDAVGLDPEEFSGRSFLDFVHEDDRATVEAELARLTRSGGRTCFSAQCLAKDDAERIFEWQAQRSEGDELLYLLGSDVTASRAERTSHRELTSRHTAILAAVPDIIAEVDTNRIYTWLNRAGHEFFGPGVIGRPVDFFFAGSTDDVFDAVQPLFDGSEETIYVQS